MLSLFLLQEKLFGNMQKWLSLDIICSKKYTVALVSSVVALAFEEMRTPYASGRGICVQKFGNVYQWKEIDKQMLHFKSTFTTKFIKRFSEIKCSSQIMHAFLSHTRMFQLFASCFVWDVLGPSPVLFCVCILHTSLPWFSIQLHFYEQYMYTQKFASTWPMLALWQLLISWNVRYMCICPCQEWFIVYSTVVLYRVQMAPVTAFAAPTINNFFVLVYVLGLFVYTFIHPPGIKMTPKLW